MTRTYSGYRAASSRYPAPMVANTASTRARSPSRGRTAIRKLPHADSISGARCSPASSIAAASVNASIDAAAQTISLPYRENPACPRTVSAVPESCTVIIPAAPPLRRVFSPA